MSKEGQRETVFRSTQVRTKLKGDASWMHRQSDRQPSAEEKPWIAEVRAGRLNGAPTETSPVSSPTKPTPTSPVKPAIERTPSSGYLIRGVFTKTDSKPAPSSTSNGSSGTKNIAKKPSESYKRIAPHTVRPSSDVSAQTEGQLSAEEQERRTEAARNVLKTSAVRQRSYVLSAARKYESTEKSPDASPVNSSPSFVAKRVELTDDDETAETPAPASTPAEDPATPVTSPAALPEPTAQPRVETSVKTSVEVTVDGPVAPAVEDVAPVSLTEDTKVFTPEKDPFEHMKPGCTKVATPLPELVLDSVVEVCRDPGPNDTVLSGKDDAPLPAPAPLSPAPVSPVLVSAAPLSPAPVSPVLESAVPLSPAPVSPVLVSAAPLSPAPVSPAPVSAAPVSAAPLSPVLESAVPLSPTPVSPAPVSPAPVSPVLVSAAPLSPTPVSPAPVSPAPVSPVLESAVPLSPTPVSPAPVSPVLVSAVPLSPVLESAVPLSPTPVSPTPVSAVPLSPTPVSPAPVSAVPVSPAPVSPAPLSPGPVSPVLVSAVPVFAVSEDTMKTDPEPEPSSNHSTDVDTLTALSDTLISFGTSSASLIDTQEENDASDPVAPAPDSFKNDEPALAEEEGGPVESHVEDGAEREPTPELSNCIVLTDDLLALTNGPEELPEPTPPSPGRWSHELLGGLESLSDTAKTSDTLDLLADDVIPIDTEAHSLSTEQEEETDEAAKGTQSLADPFDPYPIGTTSPNSSSDLLQPLSTRSINSSTDLTSHTDLEEEHPSPDINMSGNALESLAEDIIPIDTDTKRLSTGRSWTRTWETTQESHEDVPAGHDEDQQTLVTFERKSTENDSPWDRWTSPTVYTTTTTEDEEEEEEESPEDTETVTTITTIREAYSEPEPAMDRTLDREDDQRIQTPEPESKKGVVYVKEYVNATELSSTDGRESGSDYLTSSSTGYSYSSPSTYSRDSVSSTTCTYCGELVGNDAKITIEHLSIHCHPDCFKCGVCSQPMGDLIHSLFLHGGKIHCESCYSKALD